ncbi:unnamed protein product [Macrosiphum euphorbiae]|uniref:Uncharacterized protein n=1 Tax=Macrosiphum euphorbiae TaxID=13131 RepID=A0AAV0WYG7_9HEMI|nr:unnamed protein product [Macrosiphum euphorbiae]
MTLYQDKISRTNLTDTGAGMSRHSKSKMPFLGPPPPAINVITQNIEGFSVTKGEFLASLCKHRGATYYVSKKRTRMRLALGQKYWE